MYSFAYLGQVYHRKGGTYKGNLRKYGKNDERKRGVLGEKLYKRAKLKKTLKKLKKMLDTAIRLWYYNRAP